MTAIRTGSRVRLASIVTCGLVIVPGPWIAGIALAHAPAGLILLLPFVAAIPFAVRDPDVFLNAGLLLVASDLFLTRDIGVLTLKPGYLAFGYALGGALLRWRETRRHLLRDVPWLLIAAVAGLLVLNAIASIVAYYPNVAWRYQLVIVGGALVPITAVLAVARTPERIERAIAFFVLGEVLVAIYGLYQFAAVPLGLPAPVHATAALPGSTDLKRVSGISFEPAYHASYAIMALPLLLSDTVRGVRRLHPRVSAELVAAVVLLSFFLTVSRAAFLALPLVFLGTWLILRRPDHGVRHRRRRLLLPLMLSIGLVLLTSAATGFQLLTASESHIGNIGNTQEATSNAPRLSLYETVWIIVREHPWLGAGPDLVGYALPAYGMPTEKGTEHSGRANNIWLQALVDTGVFTPPFVAAVIIVALWLAWRGAALEARTIALGVALVLLVSGMFVSWFWDMKVWAVLGLALVAVRAPPPQRPLVGGPTP
jgi:O-antigen ligase